MSFVLLRNLSHSYGPLTLWFSNRSVRQHLLEEDLLRHTRRALLGPVPDSEGWGGTGKADTAGAKAILEDHCFKPFYISLRLTRKEKRSCVSFKGEFHLAHYFYQFVCVRHWVFSLFADTIAFTVRKLEKYRKL